MNTVDWTIVCGYFALTLLIGALARRRSESAASFLNASRTLPLWVAALGFFAANCGSLELVGLAAVSAQYGVVALHYYWIGAIPALIFLALYMLPVYMRSDAVSVPDFLGRRFNQQTRLFNAVTVLVLTILLAGISLYAMAQVVHPILGWSFSQTVGVGAMVVFAYLQLGGLRATIFNEILQLLVIIAAITPLTIFILRDSHGISGLLADPAIVQAHLWRGMPVASSKAPIDAVGTVFGLGFVLAVGYWTTDFRMIQRALSLSDRPRAPFLPLIAAVGKLFFPLLVVVPGLAASHLYRGASGRAGPMGGSSYDLALSTVVARYYHHGMFGLGVTAILAALMSAMAGNVSASSAVWTEDIYRTWLRPYRSEKHYVRVGRASIAVSVLLSLMTAFLALAFGNLMDYIQFILSLVSAPLFAVISLGMFTTWATPQGGFWGLVCGTTAGCLHNVAARLHVLSYGSQMNANFHGAIYAWVVAMIAICLVSTQTPAVASAYLEGLIWRRVSYSNGVHPCGARAFASPRLAAYLLALLIAATCIGLNVIYR